MVKTVITTDHGIPIVLMDSISYIDEHDRGAVVVSGSHGGVSSARYALGVPLIGVVFNDAGIGKDRAGIAGLDLLDQVGVPAMAVTHTSARIGDAADTWANGVISAVNTAAAARSVRIGMTVPTAIACLTAQRECHETPSTQCSDDLPVSRDLAAPPDSHSNAP